MSEIEIFFFMRQTFYEKVYYHFVKTTLRLGNKNIYIHEFFLDSMCEGMKIQYLPFIFDPNWSPRLNLKYTLALAGLIRSTDKKISFHLKTSNNYNQTMIGPYIWLNFKPTLQRAPANHYIYTYLLCMLS